MGFSAMQKLIALFALFSLASAAAPDVSAEVARESADNIHIHDVFENAEDKDVKKERQLKRDKDLSALQVGSGTHLVHTAKNPCAGITCGTLSCPAGFTPQEVEGHCCPYCYNPNVKVEAAVTGATGSHGGKASTFCPNVWCFPTMCTKSLT